MPHRLLVPLALCLPLAAQQVLRVGPGGFPTIQDAITAASAGDIVEVAAGSYPVFTLDKALTIAALPGAAVFVLGNNQHDPTRLRPPAGTTAHLHGLQFRNPWAYFAAATRIERGLVAAEDCVFEAPPTYQDGGLEVLQADAVLVRCLGIGFGYSAGAPPNGYENPGLVAVGARVFATDCDFLGSRDAWDTAGNAGDGVRAQDAALHFVRCTATGGSASCHAVGDGHGLRTTGTCQVWCADSALRGGDNPCAAGGDGLHHAGPLPAELARTTASGGLGSPAGQALVGPHTTAPLLGLGAPSQPLVRGQNWSVAWRTQPHGPIAVFAAAGLAPRTVPAIAQPLLLPPDAAATLVLLVADGNGDAVLATAVPASPALRAAHLHVQAVSGLLLPLQAAPALGGIVQ